MRKHSPCLSRQLQLLLLLFLVLANMAPAQIPDPLSIRLDWSSENAMPGYRLSVPIILSEGSAEIESFDFKIRFNSEVLSFYGLGTSDLFDPDGIYQWEFLTYRTGDIVESNDCSTYRTVRIIGKSDIANSGETPQSHLLSAGTILGYLNFQLAYDKKCVYSNPDYLEFYWENCEDNNITLVDLTQLVSLSVFEGLNQTEITNNSAELPSLYGMPSSCETPDNMERAINYYDEFAENNLYGMWGFGGDVNLDNQPFEISDAVVFNNYFKYGMSAFNIAIETQIWQTDVNCDGIVLTVADFVRLFRIINGVAFPCPLVE
ncbi:MAG: hypothetical protein ABIJ45_13300 [Candidatus Zixiibacteriota bacterium]